MNKNTVVTVAKAAAFLTAAAVTGMAGVEAVAPIAAEAVDTVKAKFAKTAPEAVEADIEVPAADDAVVDADAE